MDVGDKGPTDDVADKGKGIEVEACDKGKGITVNDVVVNLGADEYIEQSVDEQESDSFVDEENPVEYAVVNMDSFDKTNANTVGTAGIAK